VVDRSAVQRPDLPLGNAFDRMMSNARAAFGHTELVTPEFVAGIYTKETGYQRNCGDGLRLYLQENGAGFMSGTSERTRHQCFRVLNSVFCSVTDQVKKSLSRDCPDDTWRRIHSMLGLERSPIAQRRRQDRMDDTVKAIKSFYLDTDCQKCVSVMLVACSILSCKPPHDDGCPAQPDNAAVLIACLHASNRTCPGSQPHASDMSQSLQALQVTEQQGVGNR
jgi:hypothetical protein